MRASVVTSLFFACGLVACFSQSDSAQQAASETVGTWVKFESSPYAIWGPTTMARYRAMRIGIYTERNARLIPGSVPADLLIQNLDSEVAVIGGVNAELMFAIRVTPSPGSTADWKSVPLKPEFIRSAPRSTFSIRDYELPAKAAVRYKVDLAKWFDLKHPGSYEVRVCYAPVQEITEGYDFDKRCHLGPEVTTVIHLIPAVYRDPGQDGKEKSKQ